MAVGREGRLERLDFPRDPSRADGGHRPEPHWVRDDDAFDALRVQLEEYFAGERRDFDVEIEPRGTEFQMRVWEALRAIPYGSTTTYGAVAAAIGRPRAVRAVGGANNRNRIPIVIPCHRVVGADGSLTGFGGGLGTKAHLLELEAGVVAAGAVGGVVGGGDRPG